MWITPISIGEYVAIANAVFVGLLVLIANLYDFGEHFRELSILFRSQRHTPPDLHLPPTVPSGDFYAAVNQLDACPLKETDFLSSDHVVNLGPMGWLP